MKISKRRFHFLVQEAAQKIQEARGQGGTQTSLYVKQTYKYKKIMSVREISQMINDVKKKYTYINRGGEEIYKKRKADEERKRLIALRRKVIADAGVEVPADDFQDAYVKLDLFRLPRQTLKNINQLLNDEGEDFLFDIKEAMQKNPHRASEIKRYFSEIIKGMKLPESNRDVRMAVRDFLPGGGTGIEFDSITAVIKMPEVYRIESTENVIQTTYAEQNDLVRAYTSPPEEIEVKEYIDKETGKVIATADQVSTLYSLSKRYQSEAKRVFAASQVYAPYKVLMALARDRSPNVRAAVATNPKAHANHLEILKNDSDENVLRAVGMREIDGNKEFTVRFRGEEKPMKALEIQMNISAGEKLSLQTAEGQYISNPERILDIIRSSNASARVRRRGSAVGFDQAEALFVEKKKKAALDRSKLENTQNDLEIMESDLKNVLSDSDSSSRAKKIAKERLQRVAEIRSSLINDFDRLEELEKQIAEEEGQIETMRAAQKEASLTDEQKAIRDMESDIKSRREKFKIDREKRTSLGNASTLATRIHVRQENMKNELANVEELETGVLSPDMYQEFTTMLSDLEEVLDTAKINLKNTLDEIHKEISTSVGVSKNIIDQIKRTGTSDIYMGNTSTSGMKEKEKEKKLKEIERKREEIEQIKTKIIEEEENVRLKYQSKVDGFKTKYNETLQQIINIKREIEKTDKAAEARKQYEKSLAALQRDIQQAEQDSNYVKARKHLLSTRQNLKQSKTSLPDFEEEKSPQRQLIDAIKSMREKGISDAKIALRVPYLKKKLGL